MDELDKICKNCGCTFGAHLADGYNSSYYGRSFPKGCCPGTQGRMDWDRGPGTIFEPLKEEKDNGAE